MGFALPSGAIWSDVAKDVAEDVAKVGKMSHAFSSLALSPLHEWAPREVSSMSPVNRLHTKELYTS